MFQHASSSKTYPFSVSKLHLRALFESPILFSVLDVLLDELFRQITPPPSRLVRLGDRSSGCGWGALELEAVAPLRGFSLGRLRLRCQHLVEGVEVQRPEIGILLHPCPRDHWFCVRPEGVLMLPKGL